VPFGTKQCVCGAKEASFQDKSQIQYRPGWTVVESTKECRRRATEKLSAGEAIFEDKSQIQYRPGWTVVQAKEAV